MVRENRAPPPTPLSTDEINQLLFKNSTQYKNRNVDLDSVITRANVKKYLTLSKLNQKAESWLAVLKKKALLEKVVANVELSEDETKVLNGATQLSEDEQALIQTAQEQVTAFLQNASPVQKKKFSELTGDKQFTDVIMSFKYKFSVDAFEVITHVVNLFAREIIVYSLEECLASKLRVVQPNHIPWEKLQDKLLSGVYFNTLVVHNQIHQSDEEEQETEEEQVVEDSPADDQPAEETGSDDDQTSESEQPVEDKKIKLQQYISTLFKALCSSEERFTNLKLSKKLMAVLNELVYQVLDRYANILKTLLDVSSSKTVNGKFAVYATKILLQDHIYTTDEKTSVILDVVQDRLEKCHEQAAAKKKEHADTQTTDSTPVTDSVTPDVAVDTSVAPVKTRKSKK
jgi:hypothetical protein